MSDLEDIRRVIAEYCFATDTADTERWISLFAEDVLWEGGVFGRFTSRDGARAYHLAASDSAHYRHVTTNSIIDVDGAEASAQSYVLVFDQRGEAPALIFSGVCEDRFIRQDGRWLIKERRIHPHPSAIGEAASPAQADV